MMNIQELAEKTNCKVCNFVVTQNVYDAFQQCSGDLNPLHVDEEFAKKKGFRSCVMYGNILNAFVSYYVGMALPDKNVMIQAQDINYRKPVFLNDHIQIVSAVDDVSEAVNVIIYKLKFYRMIDEKRELVANGHVQIGLLLDK